MIELRRGRLCVATDDEPCRTLGRVQLTSATGAIVCLKTRAELDWLIASLESARQDAWPTQPSSEEQKP